MDDLLEKLKQLKPLADAADASLEKLGKGLGGVAKEAGKQKEASEKATKATKDQTVAIEELAAKAEMSASALKATGRTQETLIKVGGQYAEILRAAGKENTELEKTWKAGLSPAEKTALAMAKLEGKTSDALKATAAYSVAIGENSDKLADQIRRQDANVGSQNKLSRSLAELLDQQTTQITNATFVSAAINSNSAAYKENAEKLDSIGKGMAALRVPGAGLVMAVKDINESLAGMTKQSAAAGAALKVGLIGAGIVAGIALVATGMVAATKAAAEWNEELKGTGLQLDALSTRKLKENAEALDSVVASGKALAVSMMQTVGPAVAYVSDGMTILNLAIRDGWSKDLQEYGKQSDALTAKLREQATAEKSLADAMKLKTQYMDMVLSQATAEDSFRKGVISQIRAEGISRLEGAERARAEGAERLRALEEEYTTITKVYPAGAATIEQYEKLKRAIVQTTEQEIREARAETAAKAIDDAQKEAGQRIEAAGGQRSAVTQLAVAEEDAAARARKAWTESAQYSQAVTTAQADAGIADFGRTAAAAEAAAAKGKASWTGSFDSIGRSASTLSEMMIKSSKKQGDASEKAAIVTFKLGQAASATGIVMSTAQAVMAALVTPGPAGYAMAIAAGLAGAAQLAFVLSQSPPSSAGASASAPPTPVAYDPSGAETAASRATARATSLGAAPVTTASDMSVGSVQTSRAEPVVTVTDAHVTASSKSQLFRVAPGDEGEFRRAGALGRSARPSSDPRAIAAMEANTREVAGMRRDLQDVARMLFQRSHFAAAGGPAGAY